VQHLLLDHLALRTSQPCETSGRHGFDIARRRAVLCFHHHAEVAAAVLAAGGRVGAARTVEEVLALLDAWGILRAGRGPGLTHEALLILAHQFWFSDDKISTMNKSMANIDLTLS
jgi:hypothetical protein